MAVRVNSELIRRASEIVVAGQNASYNFLRGKLGGVGVATVSKLLHRLQAKGLVRRGKKRHWIVIVDANGSPKDASTLPPKRRFKKIRRTNRSVKVTGQQVALRAPSITAESTKSDGNHGSFKMKMEFIQHLAGLAEGSKKILLQEVLRDLKMLSREQKLLDALKD